MKRLFLHLGMIAWVIILSSCAPHDLNTTIEDVDQNALSYLTPGTEHTRLISEEKQKKLMEDYLTHYFSPWDDHSKDEIASRNKKILKTEQQLIANFKQKPGWGQNSQPHPVEWMMSIEDKMDLDNFPNANQKAIITESSSLRLLPTRRPTFTSLKEAGQGFPFDSLQTSYLPNSVPVLILHTSKNKAWHFVLAHNVFGWVRSNQVAQVNQNFIQKWKTGKYLTPAVLGAPLKAKNGQFLFYLRLGCIYPAAPNSQKNTYTILTAQKNLNDKAIISLVPVTENLLYEAPIPITPHHIALLANQMMGEPYGWGGLYGYRDCSAAMADLFAPFGIWLPRNSRDQLKAWKHISLAGLKNSEKKKRIEDKGIPMLTLIGWPGHVGLYLGAYNNQIYFFNTVWGLQTSLLFGKTGRAVFGKTIINPLNLGAGYFNIKATMLDKATTMTFLGEPPENDEVN